MTIAPRLSLKYRDGFERSAELLRLAIGLMSKHRSPPHPISYAVWYEYASGRTLELNREIDALEAKSEGVDDAMTLALYRKYLLTPDEETAAQAGDTLGHVISEVSQSTSASAQQAASYGASLAQLSEELRVPGGGGLTESVQRVLRDTDEIKTSILSLRSVLDAGRAEVEQLRQKLDQTHREALSDALTGLRNRKGFNDALFSVLQGDAEDRDPLCLVMIDIDHFKRINDSYGHLVGDKVLRSIAKALEETVKGADFVARFGGDEFAVLLPRTPLEGAKKVAQTICANISRGSIRGLHGEVLDHVTISVGVATLQPGESEEGFVGRADMALYDSKKRGRNCVTVRV